MVGMISSLVLPATVCNIRYWPGASICEQETPLLGNAPLEQRWAGVSLVVGYLENTVYSQGNYFYLAPYLLTVLMDWFGSRQNNALGIFQIGVPEIYNITFWYIYTILIYDSTQPLFWDGKYRMVLYINSCIYICIYLYIYNYIYIPFFTASKTIVGKSRPGQLFQSRGLIPCFFGFGLERSSPRCARYGLNEFKLFQLHLG